MYLFTFLPVPLSLRIHEFTQPLALQIFCSLLILALVALKWRRDAVVFIVALTLTLGTVFFLKEWLAVPRPSGGLVFVDGYAFPSGHAAFGMFFAVMLTWLMERHAKSRRSTWLRGFEIVLFLLAYIVGVSRVSIGVHTTVQVLAGFLVGILVPLLVIYVQARFPLLHNR